MPLTRPFAIDQAYANASDFRKQHAAVFPREGVFPDPVTTAAAGVAYPNGGWNVGARIFTAVARRGTAPFSQVYGSALISNDSQTTAWTIPAAPATGSRIDLLWVKATDPTQGDATTTPSGETVARAVPVFGVTSGTAATTPTAPALPSGAVEIGRVTTSSTATSIANSVFTHSYSFANVLGGPWVVRLAAELTATNAATAALGEVAYVIETGATYRRSSAGTARWVRQGGGTFVGTRSQEIGNGQASNLGAFNRDGTYSDRDDFYDPTTRRLAEGDYAVSLTMSLNGVSGTGRNFVGFSGGGIAARNGFGSGEDTVTVSGTIHIPAAGESLTYQAFLTVASSPNTPNFRLQITKTA